MKRLILPDTNFLILAQEGTEPHASLLRSWLQEKRIIFSVVVAAEYLVGASSSDATNFLALLTAYSPIPIDLSVAQTAAQYRKQFMKKKKVFLIDCLIAATCKSRDLLLATADKKDYPMNDIEVIPLPRQEV